MNLEPPPPPRSPWQRLYAAAHRLRRRWYQRHRRVLPVPVVSLGNLHWGGTGKTPLVAALAVHLRDQGRHVAILSRGYGRRGHGVGLVSAGQGALLTVEEAGDEPVLLAEIPGVAVVVDAHRYSAGVWALQNLDPAPDLFLLDDGFSHLGLYRDLDLLALPAHDPFGGGRLPPGGRLREPLEAVRHADAAILTGVENCGTEEDGKLGDELARSLRPHGFAGAGFVSRLRVKEAVPVPAVAGWPETGGRVVLVTAVAHPERVVATASARGFDVLTHLVFGDHHPYPRASLERIERVFRQSGAQAVLTTTKDRVKLAGRLQAPLAELRVEAAPEAGFWHWLDGALTRSGKAASPGGVNEGRRDDTEPRAWGRHAP